LRFANRNRGAKQIDMIIVHVAQGSYSGTISWFQYRRSNVSAHYVVGRRGRVAQCVHNEDIAWHAGNWRYNTKSIGIEHAGYAGNPKTWTKRMYRSSAKLSAYLSKRYNIPVDRRHIIGHREVPGVNKTCPGRYFNFDRYLRLIRRFR
jgi:N-acetyl-anhydromuramyl-L-alanine amidase AmpD